MSPYKSSHANTDQTSKLAKTLRIEFDETLSELQVVLDETLKEVRVDGKISPKGFRQWRHWIWRFTQLTRHFDRYDRQLEDPKVYRAFLKELRVELRAWRRSRKRR